jgi:hypothetical protein
LKKYTKSLLALAIACLIIGACKLDKPVDPVANPETLPEDLILGITVQGGTINDSYLSSRWQTVRTVQQIYDTANVVTSGMVVPNRFTGVTLNDQTKAIYYTGLTPDPGSSTYKLGTTSNVLFINLLTNPFFTSPTADVRITRLTSTAMTWVALDTTSTPIDGKYFHKGYEVTFTK